MENYKELFNKLMYWMKRKKASDLFYVQDAFELAERLHAGQTRATGEPYILHPVQVAAILEKQNFDSEVVAAALLHDVVEDCGYTIKEIETAFNTNIAEIVDGVTAISEQEAQGTAESLFTGVDVLKANADEQTMQKLIAIGKGNRLAFFIKFADRLHNLRTIWVMPEYKQREKVRDTERWILPLCQLLKTNYFYNKIKNECFKIKNREAGNAFFTDYDRFFRTNKKNRDSLREEIFLGFNAYLVKNKAKGAVSQAIFIKRSEEELAAAISAATEIKRLQFMKLSHILKVPAIDIILLHDKSVSQKMLADNLLSFLGTEFTWRLHVCGFEHDAATGYDYIIAADNLRHKCRIRFSNTADYVIFKNGSIEGSELDDLDEDNPIEIIYDYISVKTRSGETIKMPQGATALDFAFRLHNDIGFASKYAQINDSPTNFPLYTKLNDGDKVSIVTETDPETGLLKNMARLRWLAYVKTQGAQKALIRHFEKIYKE